MRSRIWDTGGEGSQWPLAPGQHRGFGRQSDYGWCTGRSQCQTLGPWWTQGYHQSAAKHMDSRNLRNSADKGCWTSIIWQRNRPREYK